MKFLLRLVLNSVGVLAVSYIIPGLSVSSFVAALVFALVLGVVNALVRPLMLLLTLPVTILTLGFFTLIINACLFWFTSLISVGVEVQTFFAAFWGGLLVWTVSGITNWLFKDDFEDGE